VQATPALVFHFN